jgi:murein DD-endopeptidase MepM/ murein hydrolase activator NlpD
MAATDAVEPLVDTPERPSIDLTATIGQGDGFARVLERAAVAASEAKTVASRVSGIVALGAIRPGTRIDLTLGRRASRAQARPLDVLAFRARFDLRLALERVNGALSLRQIPIAVDNTPLRVQGRVGSSLYVAARGAGAPADAVASYIRALSARMPISRVRTGDRFDLIVEQRRAATGEVETGALLYAGLDQGKSKTRLLKWTSGGRSQFFEASGVGERRGGMTQPVSGRMTSSFGMRRHPLLGYSRFHRGVDYGAAYGSPIVAASAGVVSYSGWHGGHGKYVMIQHGGGMATAYGHMSRIVARNGARVAQGQVIGYVGSTGLSTGPHLHYEMYRNGQSIDPSTVRFVTRAQLEGRELADFRAQLDLLQRVEPGAALAPLAPDPAFAEEPAREIDRLESRQRIAG